jgi:hypothetical protein
MRLRRRSSYRFTLLPSQHVAINQVAQSLPPTARHDFLLRVSDTLRLNGTGFVSDEQVQGAIASALAEADA